MKINHPRLTFKHPKRLIIIIISVLIVLSVATYGIFSYFHWRDYDQNSQKSANTLKTTVDSSLGSDKTSPAVTAQIDTIVTDFEKTYGTTPCNISPWYSWQNILPQLKEMQNTCDKRFATTLTVISALKPLAQFLKDEQKASELLTTAIEATEAPTDYAAASLIWKAAGESKDLPTDQDFATVRTKSIEVTVAISAAYTALVSAISKEDKTAFDTATASLKTAYTSLDSLKVTVNDERMKLITAFISTYEKL